MMSRDTNPLDGSSLPLNGTATNNVQGIFIRDIVVGEEVGFVTEERFIVEKCGGNEDGGSRGRCSSNSLRFYVIYLNGDLSKILNEEDVKLKNIGIFFWLWWKLIKHLQKIYGCLAC